MLICSRLDCINCLINIITFIGITSLRLKLEPETFLNPAFNGFKCCIFWESFIYGEPIKPGVICSTLAQSNKNLIFI